MNQSPDALPSDKFRAGLRKILPWLPILLAFLLVWVARYWHSPSFGLYEDDLTIVPRAVSMSLPEVLRFIYSYIIHLYGHARPLSDSAIYLFSHLGWKLGGLQGIYLIGYLIEVLNASLFYLLLRRVASWQLSLIAVIAYCLFSADTTQAFLTHSLGLQPSITLLLLASHCYLSGKPWLAYALMLIMLFSYETPFLVFGGVPLLKKAWDRPLVKEMARHLAVLAVMILAIFILRSFIGEGRVAGLSSSEILTVPVSHVVEGVAVSLGTYLYRPLQALNAARRSWEVGAAGILALPFFVIVLFFSQPKASLDWRLGLQALRTRSLNSLPEEIRATIKLGLAGLVMLALAYPLTFTTRAYAITGRDTRVHSAAVAGAAIVFSAVVVLIFELARRYRLQWLVTFGTAVLFALLVGYGFVVQSDYSLAWKYQRQFWTEILPLISDAHNGTVILVEPSAFKDTAQIGANTWNLPRILAQLFALPQDWKNPPAVYRMTPGWQKSLAAEGSQFRLDSSTVTAPPSMYGSFDSRNTILIVSSPHGLARQNAPLQINGQAFPLKQSATTAPLQNYAPVVLYDLIIQSH